MRTRRVLAVALALGLAEASAELVPAERVRAEVLSRALAEGILLHGG